MLHKPTISQQTYDAMQEKLSAYQELEALTDREARFTLEYLLRVITVYQPYNRQTIEAIARFNARRDAEQTAKLAYMQALDVYKHEAQYSSECIAAHHKDCSTGYLYCGCWCHNVEKVLSLKDD